MVVGPIPEDMLGLLGCDWLNHSKRRPGHTLFPGSDL
jgi:hypothetical protein